MYRDGSEVIFREVKKIEGLKHGVTIRREGENISPVLYEDNLYEMFGDLTNKILYSLGTGYASGGEFTENIDKMGGKGTAEFVFQAIKIYCGK